MADIFKVSGQRSELPKSSGAKYSLRPGGWIVAEDANGKRRRIAIHEAKGRLSVSADGTLYIGDLISGRDGAAAAGTDADLIAQFPGKIRKILVQDGQTVEAGAALMMVEAMKMEFPIKAPFAGRVKKVLVAEGQQIQPGDRFIELETKS